MAIHLRLFGFEKVNFIFQLLYFGQRQIKSISHFVSVWNGNEKVQ